MNINKLPEYFAIKWSDNPLWKDYISWLNETYNVTLNGTATKSYYGFAGKITDTFYMYCISLSDFKNPVTELTLEQWDNIVNKKDEFVLPDKWAFKVTLENYQEFKHLRSLINNNRGYITSEPYGHLSWGVWRADLTLSNLKEITFEQFKKYVLKNE